MKLSINLVSLLLCLTLLTSCVKANFNTDCGILIPYPDDYQETVANQADSLSKDDYKELLGMIKDYKQTRDSIRSCRKYHD